MITDEQVNFYRENGFVVIENVFTDDEAKRYNQCIRRHANKDFAAIVNPDREEVLLAQDERVKSDVTLEEIKETAELSEGIMKDPKIVSILERLQEKQLVGLSSQFIFKEAHSVYAPQAWRPHQDGYYPQDVAGEYVTVNWFLRGADMENGTIYVYAGSHKEGLLEAPPTISFREDPKSNPGAECEVPEKYLDKKTTVIVPYNSVVFLHGHCIHGSYPNNSNRSRPWFSCCYISEGAPYVVGKNAQRKQIALK